MKLTAPFSGCPTSEASAGEVARIPRLKRVPRCGVVFVLAAGVLFGQGVKDEPTKKEITEAYRSKAGESVLLIPRVRWERWIIKEIRGWSLKFKRLSEDRYAGVLILRYQAVAKKNNNCAEYQIVDTVAFPPMNQQIKPSLTVEPQGVKPCR